MQSNLQKNILDFIDLYREYCKDSNCLKGKQEYRKAVAKERREKALATAYNNQ